MSDFKVIAHSDAIDRFGDAFIAALRTGTFRIRERGRQILGEEVPKVTHNLEQGIDTLTEENGPAITITFLVRAWSNSGGGTGIVHLPKGGTKTVPLKAQEKFDYAEAVVKGTGIYGPKGTRIEAKSGQDLMVAVNTPPSDEEYIEANGRTYVVRKWILGMKPNPYDQRASKRLFDEAPDIFTKALSEAMSRL